MTGGRWTWKNVDLPDTSGDFAAATAAFLTGIYEEALGTQPDNTDVLAALGELYTREGLFEKGLEMDRRLVALRPEDPVVRYNLACSLSLLRQSEASFAELAKAIKLGYDEFEHMLSDPDLENLRKDVRWSKLLETLRDLEASG